MNEQFVLTLIERFNAASLAELDLSDGGSRLVLRRESAFAHNTPGPDAGADVQAARSRTAPGSGSAGNTAQARPDRPVSSGGNDTINSPIVATFYSAPGPDAPPFVKPGSKVKAGDSLCILEAMKMMNHLEAEFDCEIISALVKSGDLVEYGQALFEVKRL